MLTQLSITNFAIFDHIELDLSDGMTVFSGETGAGKSIICDAIAFALGQRAQSDMVKSGCDKATICAVFDTSQLNHIRQLLKQQSLDNDNPICCLRRVIYSDGRSKCFLNDIPITQQFLKKISNSLLNIHGQHDNQNLFEFSHQLNLLDGFGQQHSLRKQIAQHVKDWKKINQQIINLQGIQSTASEIDFLTYQLEELNRLDLKENELTSLLNEHRQLNNSDLLQQHYQKALFCLEIDQEDSHVASIDCLLHTVHQSFSEIIKIDPLKHELLEWLTPIMIQTQEITHTLRHQFETISNDPNRLNLIEQRLTQINDAARKYRVDVNELIDFQIQLQEKLLTLHACDDQLQSLQQALKTITTAYDDLANQLTQHRAQIAPIFSTEVTQLLHQLGMPNSQFQATLQPIADEIPNTHGKEKINFLISTNPGQPLKPLSHIASGGELSRISLAIRVITAQLEQTPTLIFDEVDTGIGGGTAEIVGQLLKRLGNSAQVFCVTHLPQVAAQGHHHFCIVKQGKEQTNITATRLNHEERIHEIARMLGGVTITEQALKHAEEILNNLNGHVDAVFT